MVTQDGLIRLGSRVFSRDEGIPPHELDNGDFGPALLEPQRGARP
jgi:acetylglutamate kinase